MERYFDMWVQFLRKREGGRKSEWLDTSCLRHPLSGAGAAQAGCAGAAGQDRSGVWRRRLAGTSVLQKDVHAATTSCLPGYSEGRLALTVCGLHVDPVLHRHTHPRAQGYLAHLAS